MASKAVMRYALAVFPGWQQVLPAVMVLALHSDIGQTIALLGEPSRFEDPALVATTIDLSTELKQSIESRRHLSFGKPAHIVCCTDGDLAEQLSRRAGQDCTSFADALGFWIPGTHAARLDDELRRGRIILWARLFKPEQEHLVCETLLAQQSLRVEVHDLSPILDQIIVAKTGSGKTQYV